MTRCLRCNAELAEGAAFCAACGERVAAAGSPPPAPALTAADIDAARAAVRSLNERADQLRPEAINALITAAQAPLATREEVAALNTRLEQLEQGLLAAQRIATTGPTADPERTHGFRSMEEFLVTALRRHSDPRLHAATVTEGEQQRDMAMLPGAAGGFLIPPQFADMLTAITPQDAIVRPRATVMPAGIAPDASVTFPMLNQSGALGVFAGMTGGWTGEGGLKPETQPALASMTLTPHEVAAFVDVTDKLLRNNPAAVTQLIQQGFRDVILSLEDIAFITGNGVGRPRGFLGHASNVNVARAGGGAIIYADVVNMLWRMLKLGTAGPVWLAHPSTLPQLQGMASVLGQLIWQPSAREGLPSTLMGFPVFVNERQPVLGAVGDLMFVNLRYYMIQEGVGLAIKDDQGIGQFDHNITRVKAYRSVDGQPTLATPLLLEDAVTTVSPFVVLN
jgi:HK97 family phage major capsid protein